MSKRCHTNWAGLPQEAARQAHVVPSYETYRGLTLPEALLELVEHHGNSRTRNLSQCKCKLLEVAADWLGQNGRRIHVQQ